MIEPVIAVQLLQNRIRDVGDVRAIRFERGDFDGIDVEANDRKMFFPKPQYERQTDIPQTDNADPGLIALDFPDQLIFNTHLRPPFAVPAV